MNENIPHCLRHLSTWSTFGGTVWGTFGVCLAGGSVSREEGFEMKASHFCVFSFCFLLVVEDVSSELLVLAAKPLFHDGLVSLWSLKLK